MTLTIVITILFLAGFGGFFLWVGQLARRGKKQRAALAQRRATARPGRARVVASRSVQQGGAIDGAVSVVTQIYLTLDVETTAGLVRAEAVWDVSDMLKLPQLADGSVIDVLVDSVDPKYVFPSVPWAKQSGMDPVYQALWDPAKHGTSSS